MNTICECGLAKSYHEGLGTPIAFRGDNPCTGYRPKAEPPAEKCPKCGHMPHGRICFNMASDNDCDCVNDEPEASPSFEEAAMRVATGRLLPPYGNTEFSVMWTVYRALSRLDRTERKRVMEWVTARLMSEGKW